MDRTDLTRTDDHSAAFCRGWALAFPEKLWIAGVDLQNIQRPREYRLKAAKPSWSGPAMTESGRIADSFDVHIECKMKPDDSPKGNLLLHMETNPYQYLGNCSCGDRIPECEVCHRRQRARESLISTFGDSLGGWKLAANKLTLVKHALTEVADTKSEQRIASFLVEVSSPLDRWVEEAQVAWSGYRA